mmetsp:Transcript_14047/g.19492  ORF Transcript_14047/g.19492 Transcript_14047/m.19492 type:complete len:613 (+) Transcript_14047:315-2153(+)
MKFHKKLREHVRRSRADERWYVDYGILKQACKQNCSEEDFRKLYLREAMKFLGNMRKGQALDPQFMEINLLALEKACKKFDKRNGLKEPERLETGLSLTACPERFQVRLQKHLESMGYRVQVQIQTVKERIERLFVELKGNLETPYLDEEALRKGLEKLKLPSTPAAAKELLRAADADGDGKVSFRDFKDYVLQRERTIREIFSHMDREKDGSLSIIDLVSALRMLGIQASEDDVAEFILKTHQRLGDSAPMSDRVDFITFRELLVLIPCADSESLFEYWQQAVDFDFAPPDESPSLNKKSFLETFIAGGVAGAVSRTCTAPLDRLKLLLQTDTEGKYNGIVQGMKTIYEEGKQHRLKSSGQIATAQGWRGMMGGFLSFFRGNGTNVVKIAPETAIKFWAYETAKLQVCNKPEAPTGIERFTCGAIGGITAQTCIYPLEIVKTRLAVSKPGTYNGITHCLFKIIRKEGFGALYKGLQASVLGIIPYSGVDMAVYFTLRDYYKDTGPMGMMGCGAVSSTCGMVCSFPLQLIRTRLQATGLDGMPRYRGIWHCFTSTIRKDGFLGLYRGFGPNMLKALPAISITYTVYETVKKRLIETRMTRSAWTTDGEDSDF